MFSFRKPSDEQIREYLARQVDQPFSYEPTGGTRHVSPVQSGWNTDRARALLGQGESSFQRAKHSIDHWHMFPAEVASIGCPHAPQEGQNVAVLYWAAPIHVWLLMAARVIYVFSESFERGGKRVEQFGFGYGTLPDHPERGEERFMVEWDHNDDNVWYDLLAVSQPAHWLARLGYPYTRYEQGRFRRLSCAAMQRAVAG
jgi:uncharacterized protein (UPF0548 family)